MVAGLLSLIAGSGDGNLLVKYMLIHPAIQTELVLAGAGGIQHARAALGALQYGERSVIGFGLRPFGVWHMTFVLTVTAVVYIGAGALFFLGAKHRLRRNVF